MQVFLITLALIASGVAVAQTPAPPGSRLEMYTSAAVDANGDLAIVKSNGQTVIVRKEREQTSFSPPLLSSANTAVGAQAMFANCCTSYDIPLQLVVYAAGRVHRFKGVGLPIFQWGFADAGTRIAYGQETVHFARATHYELREITSERLIESVDVPQPCGQLPDPKPVKIPQWVASVQAKR
jgi:hypothetical protein